MQVVQKHLLQVGRAPLHVAAETGNLESLIRLLDAGAHRAPRDRVSPSTPLMMHATVCTMAFSFFSCTACCYLHKTWWALAEDISLIASQKAERHAYATQHAAAISHQLPHQTSNKECQQC